MAVFKISVSGKKLDPKKLTKTALDKAELVLQIGALKIQTDAQQLVPVKTSNLKTSITLRVERKADKISAYVGSNAKNPNEPVPYAKFVEFGTSKMAARPYLRPAISKNTPQIEKNLKKIFS